MACAELAARSAVPSASSAIFDQAGYDMGEPDIVSEPSSVLQRNTIAVPCERDTEASGPGKCWWLD